MASVAPEFSGFALRNAERLLTELRAVWAVLAENTVRIEEGSQGLVLDRPPGSIPEAREQYEQTTRALLVEPVERFIRLRPIRRSLEAMQEFDRTASSGAVQSRAHIDVRFQALLTEAALDLCEPWRIRRSGAREEEWLGWKRRQAARAKQAESLLATYQTWTVKAASAAEAQNKDEQLHDKRRQKRVELWWRKQTAVNAMLEMEVAFRDLSLGWLIGAENLIANLQRDREEILWLAQKMLQWVKDGAKLDTPAPAESLILPTAEERLRVWSNSVEEETSKQLPESAELLLSGAWTHWLRLHGESRMRVIRPREAFLSAFRTYCQPAIRQSVLHYWERSAAIFREVGRSKEIIDYWRDAAVAHANQAETLFHDARNNAANLLTEQLQIPITDEKLDSTVVKSFRDWGSEGWTVLEAAQIGWVELLRKPRGRRLFGAAVREGRRAAKRWLHRTSQWSADQWDRVLETVGGKLPARPATTPVVRRSTLRDTLSLPASKSELPAIYGSLFRLVPIEDQRFLIGREQELAGLEQALKDWDAGRFAACVCVGARGSGKTSLLNCATNGAFTGRGIIRAQFRERALSTEAIDMFLRELLALAPDADLEAAFRAERRILMIEEAERTYLRKVGGFRGVHHLMRWIQRTASTTLWVIAMNDKAFRVLCAGVQFSRVFSHRINAMSVSRADLENAILARHRLSGLRLDFAPPPAGDPRVGRVRNWLGLEQSYQKLFFDSLYQQSGGVFRSAFDLWLSSIERVEGETLKIRQPLEPAFAQFRNELEQEDHFTLLIIQEHGSLTCEEVALVLCEDLDVSRGRMDRLVTLGLIEKDPEHPGLRVRPEAQRFTNDALRRVNLG